MGRFSRFPLNPTEREYKCLSCGFRWFPPPGGGWQLAKAPDLVLSRSFVKSPNPGSLRGATRRFFEQRFTHVERSWLKPAFSKFVGNGVATVFNGRTHSFVAGSESYNLARECCWIAVLPSLLANV